MSKMCIKSAAESGALINLVFALKGSKAIINLRVHAHVYLTLRKLGSHAKHLVLFLNSCVYFSDCKHPLGRDLKRSRVSRLVLNSGVGFGNEGEKPRNGFLNKPLSRI